MSGISKMSISFASVGFSCLVYIELDLIVVGS